MASPPESPIRVAIIGGGLAGAALANALVQLPHLAVHVFESAPAFSERGAAVGLSANAQQALQHVLSSSSSSPESSATNTAVAELLSRADAVVMNSSRVMLGSGPQAGTMLVDMAGTDPDVVVHRASLLRELLAPLPAEVLHANKKLLDIKIVADDNDDRAVQRVQLTFQDSTSETFDAVIGADGIFSTVRDFLLEEDWGRIKEEGNTLKNKKEKKYAATPAGFWDCRVLVPYETAKSIIGPEHFKEDRQFAWIGEGAFILHDVLENRTMVQCVISAIETDDDDQVDDLTDDQQGDISLTESPLYNTRKRPLTREFLNKTLAAWLDGPIARGIIDLVLSHPSPNRYSQYEHKTTPSYNSPPSSGRTLPIVLTGDAAHATTPFQGAGAGQAFEDAMILGVLFANITSASQIPAAFRAFDAVRRPRCQQVIDSSREMGYIVCGRGPGGVGLDPDRLKGAMGGKWAFLFGLDFDEYKKEAVEMMREELEKEKGKGKEASEDRGA